MGENLESETFVEAGEKTRGGIFYPTICVMKSFGLYINSHCDYDAGFPLRSPFIRDPYDQKNEERSPWSTETAESTINSLSGLDTSVSLLTQAPLVDYRNLPRLALVRDRYSP